MNRFNQSEGGAQERDITCILPSKNPEKYWVRKKDYHACTEHEQDI